MLKHNIGYMQIQKENKVKAYWHIAYVLSVFAAFLAIVLVTGFQPQ